LETGGAERQLAELVTRMDPARFRPIVVCQKGGGEFFDQIVAAGIPAHRFELPGKWDPRFAWRLAALCRKERVQAIVVRGFSTGVVGRLVATALGIRPRIMAEHSTGRVDPDPKKRPIERLLAPLTDGVIAVANGQIPFLVDERGYAREKIRVVYNGIDLADWAPRPRSAAVLAELSIPEDVPVVGILAMLRPEKDHETFLRAAKIVRERVPNAHFLVVGDGQERARLEALARELGIDEAVRFTGRRADIPELLSVFDVSVLTSVTIETFPMAFLEAMALAIPLVATRVGGIPEMIDEGENGFVVPLRDPHALADALVRVVSDRETRDAFGARSRAIVEERFTMDAMVRGTERFLDSFFAD
jgi:glycosyltransferase involved in cell wall biosynthesis